MSINKQRRSDGDRNSITAGDAHEQYRTPQSRAIWWKIRSASLLLKLTTCNLLMSIRPLYNARGSKLSILSRYTGCCWNILDAWSVDENKEKTSCKHVHVAGRMVSSLWPLSILIHMKTTHISSTIIKGPRIMDCYCHFQIHAVYKHNLLQQMLEVSALYCWTRCSCSHTLILKVVIPRKQHDMGHMFVWHFFVLVHRTCI